MAAPLVAGAAALMFEANPTLTPNLVKSLMMYSAQQLANYNTFEQGAGELNIDGAVRLAKLVRTTSTAQPSSALHCLTSAPPAPQTTITIPTAHHLHMVAGRRSRPDLRDGYGADHSVSKDLRQWRVAWRRRSAW